jgi:hypothetical protein
LTESGNKVTPPVLITSDSTDASFRRHIAPPRPAIALGHERGAVRKSAVLHLIRLFGRLSSNRMANESGFSGRQVGVYRRHYLRAFANGGGDAFYRLCPDIADGEHAAPGGLQCMAALSCRVGTRENETLGVERDPGAAKPIGIWFSADE